MSEPCVKGTLFQNLAAELGELISQGKLTREQRAKLIKPDEIALLERDISISAWYPIELYVRMLKLYAEAADGDVSEFLIESGRRAASRVVALGIYSQLDSCPEERWENRVGRILVTLSGSFFNFTEWEWEGLSGNGFSIVVRRASPMADELVLRSSGFVEFLATRAAAGPVSITWERSADREEIRFRAERAN